MDLLSLKIKGEIGYFRPLNCLINTPFKKTPEMKGGNGIEAGSCGERGRGG